MFSRFSLFAVVLAFGLVSGLSLSVVLKPSKLKLPTNKKILGLQQQTEELAARAPGNSAPCFDYYIPIINGLSDQYQLDYNKCAKDYDTASELVLAAWNSTLFGIQASGDSGCNTFFDCSSIVDSVLAFECFANVGAEQSKIMYQVSANATEAAVQIKIHLQTLDSQLETCLNYSERDFVEGTAHYYEELNKCLAGAPVPQETTTNWYYTTA
ncbi:protein TsetseEP [Drosophila sechellia]|uniref:GM12239 n=1 Tax=Drosophila sechellia TaxID=7238 RepID=B4HZA8_DROSE|nr:protein TsetseEP [Drosophila sechellia]EDW53365.1 GM12239 [Drosophila sechellia]